jgi:hypothetical protein
MKYKLVSRYYLICIALLFLFHLPAIAQDITLVPSISLTGGYDDNVGYDRKDEQDDFYSAVSPALKLKYATDLLNFTANAKGNFIFFLDETDYNTIDQKYEAEGEYQFAKRWFLLGDFSYIKDETTDTQLEETGRAFNRDDRRRIEAGGGLRHQLSELSNIGTIYEYSKTDYDQDENEDFTRQTIGGFYRRQLKNQRNTLGIEPSFSWFESDVEEAYGYLLTIGWEHLYSETFTFELYFGGFYADIDDKVADEDDNHIGPVGGIEFKKTGEIFTALLGYDRGLRISNDGDLIEVDRFTLRADQKLTERLGMRFSGRLTFSDNISDNINSDRDRYYELEPAIYFLITENSILELVYNHQNEEDNDRPEDDTVTRNRAWMSITIKFPKKW